MNKNTSKNSNQKVNRSRINYKFGNYYLSNIKCMYCGITESITVPRNFTINKSKSDEEKAQIIFKYTHKCSEQKKTV